ncbi:MAG: metallophosphoesterase [Pirellulales bacterium]
MSGRLACLVLAILLSAGGALAGEPAAVWTFAPSIEVGPRQREVFGSQQQSGAKPSLSVLPAPLVLDGELPTERRFEGSPPNWPQAGFSVELWLVNHVNQPVGALMAGRASGNAEPVWRLSYADDDVVFALSEAQGKPALARVKLPPESGHQQYWHHFVATSDGKTLRLFVNGAEKATAPLAAAAKPAATPQLELAAYLAHEPWMTWGDLVKLAAVYPAALEPAQVRQRFEALAADVDAGRNSGHGFRLLAGPYLHHATKSSVSLSWETSAPAAVTIEYGKALNKDKQLAERLELPVGEPIGAVELRGLEPETTYFYRLSAVNADGDKLDSGLLSFKTAVRDDSPFTFALLGDPETRPHIGRRVAELAWDERPDFALNVGDLTDGGEEPHKWQWNLEYFPGLGALHKRVAVFPVPGNGEGDLYWYKRYHLLPEPEGYYSFRYGNAEFFLLDSNQRREAFAPGGEQYAWLDKALGQSQATWKFVAHHHDPYSPDDDDHGDAWSAPSTLGDEHVRQIVPVLERHNVDVVFFGHLHTYMRSRPIRGGRVAADGVRYVQAGGAGGNLEDFAPGRAWFAEKTFRGHHYCTVAIDGRKLTLRMHDLQGALRDEMIVEKPAR